MWKDSWLSRCYVKQMATASRFRWAVPGGLSKIQGSSPRDLPLGARRRDVFVTFTLNGLSEAKVYTVADGDRCGVATPSRTASPTILESGSTTIFYIGGPRPLHVQRDADPVLSAAKMEVGATT